MIENFNIITYLTKKYETSNRGPGFVSTGNGDIGGQSYGSYQLASNVGSVNDFINWLIKYPKKELANYGKVLNQYQINSKQFINLWQEIGNIDSGNFEMLQDEYIIEKYYNPTIQRLKAKYFNINNHSLAMKSIVLSRSIQNGGTGCINLLEIVCTDWYEYPNLSYLDNKYFDKDFIIDIYNFLINECDSVYWDYNLNYYRSTYNFCHAYTMSVINGLRNRFVHEKEDALELLFKYN